jgi:endo-1,4-beta-xylanase
MRAARRRLLQGAIAASLTGCGEPRAHAAAGGAARAAPRRPPLASLKAAARFPVGTCLATPSLDDPDLVALTLRQFSQITPEWEMKMERILADDGSYRFDAADRIAGFCADHGLPLHATTLAWYAQSPIAFQRIADDRRQFETSYRNYIGAVVGRYRGLARGWDVLNEAVAEDGDGYRGGLWEQVLGPDYARIAFETCRDADPAAVRFLNDYNLETRPAKLDAFQRLLERLLKAGAPVTGVGTQTHLSADLAPGRASLAIRALARFGLPIHVSELDVSTRAPGWSRGSASLAQQARVVDEVAEAFMALPAAQRYAFTVWGVRDRDSWLRRPPNQGDGDDRPLLFDDDGQPKPAFDALLYRFESAPA